MKITLNTKTPIVYDFLRVIMFKYNDIDFIEQLSENGYIVSERVGKALSYIWEDLDANIPGVALFFNYTKENRCYMFNKFDRIVHEFNDINELIAQAFEGPVEDLQISLLEYFDNEKRELSFYKHLFEDDATLFEFINSLEIPVICRWELYGIIRKPEEILEPLKLFCHRVKRKLRNVYKENAEIIKSFNKGMNVKLKTQEEQIFKKELSGFLNKNYFKEDKDIEITYSLINETLFYSYQTEDTFYFILGLEYETLIKNHVFRDSSGINDAFLKVFSDKSRMSIFRSLLNEEMFVGQIAESQGMILSTTSYHLDLLLSVGVLTARSHGKKIFYSVNKELVSDQLRKIADLIEKGIY